MHTDMRIRTNTHTHTRQHTHTHANIRTRTYTPAYTHTTEETHNSSYQSPQQAFRVSTYRTNPNPDSPHQRTNLIPRVLSPPDQSTAPIFSLSHSSTSLRFSLAPMHSRAHPRSLSHPSLTYASPPLSRVAYFDSVLPRTRARNRAPSRRRSAPPNVRNSRTYDCQDAPTLGPRDCKLAPFPSKFSEPPTEATE
jgi:hypothetical protein